MTNTNRAAIQYECGTLAWFPGTVSVTGSIHSTVGFAVSIGRRGPCHCIVHTPLSRRGWKPGTDLGAK